jgi:orotate phosphoribosyltransferase
MVSRDRLLALLIERSLRLGRFTLASGARSTYYVDARATTMTAEGQALVGRVCLSYLRRSDLDPTHVGGLTMGADPIAYAIACRSWEEGRPVDAFSVRKDAKEYGTRRRIEGGLPTNAHVVVIEDAMTTGRSTLKAIRAVEEHGARVLAVLALVDREEGACERIAAEGYPVTAVFPASELVAAAQSSNRRGITRQR